MAKYTMVLPNGRKLKAITINEVHIHLDGNHDVYWILIDPGQSTCGLVLRLTQSTLLSLNSYGSLAHVRRNGNPVNLPPGPKLVNPTMISQVEIYKLSERNGTLEGANLRLANQLFRPNATPITDTEGSP